MPEKRKQKIHSPELFEYAKRLIRTDGFSIRKAAGETGIPFQTLRDHVNGKYASVDTSFGPSRLLSDESEQSLSNYAVFMAKRGVPLSRQVVKKLAQDIIKHQGGGVVSPSDKWIKSYLKRHPELTCRTAHPLQQDRATITQETLDDYFQLLERTLTMLNLVDKPGNIYNCDESGFSGKLNPTKKVIVPRGTRHAYQTTVNMSGHITMLNAISASGSTLPPMLIYSQCLPRQYGDGVPDDWIFKTTEKGYITSDLFVEWFMKCFIAHVGERRPILLILDNHVTHLSKAFIDAARDNRVELLYLPAHSSHILQPQDCGYFHVVKQKVADMAIQLGYMGVKTLQRGVFPKLLHQALNRITGATVAAAFKCTGIVPLNKTAVAALLPSSNNSPDPDKDVPSTSALSVPSVIPPIERCSECGKCTQNPLVTMGLVAPELANILVQPPVPPVNNKKSGRKKYTKARAVLTEQYENEPPTKQQRVDDNGIATDNDNVLCQVCMIGNREGFFWVGCDDCDRWFHYECLPGHVQVDVDLSLVTSDKWICGQCREE